MAKNLSENKSFVLAPGLRPPLPVSQSQNPQISAAAPAVLLNRRDRIRLKIRRDSDKAYLWASSSINRKSLVSRFKDPEKGSRMGVSGMTLLALLILANLPAVAFAQSSCPGIHVNILNIRNSSGNVACALFDSAVGFPIEYLRSAMYVIATKIQKTEASCDFVDIPPGNYAIAAVHDENMNGKLETNWLGFPKEGYGFSNEAEGFSGEPSFSAASFQYDGRRLDLTISLNY